MEDEDDPLNDCRGYISNSSCSNQFQKITFEGSNGKVLSGSLQLLASTHSIVHPSFQSNATIEEPDSSCYSAIASNSSNDFESC